MPSQTLSAVAAVSSLSPSLRRRPPLRRQRASLRTSRLPLLVLLSLLLLTFLSLAPPAAAFDFFNLFGDDAHQQQQQRSQQQQSTSTNSGCSRYQCPDTSHCVPSPRDCPCPNAAERKCNVGDWYVCIRGDRACEALPTAGAPLAAQRVSDEL
ncbi:hypothetical protein HDU89_001193 [Geranomyces variabilis]|nr:hypothetical protein HDU89_001193 [Geranomyces variabilis]